MFDNEKNPSLLSFDKKEIKYLLQDLFRFFVVIVLFTKQYR